MNIFQINFYLEQIDIKMSKTETSKAEAATNSGAAAKVTDLGLLEEDDEFEEFPVEGKNVLI